ncbi:MAG: hypothetical protein AAF250_00085 [Pseudomonadota bacterium]
MIWRRIVAAVALFGFAVGSALFWNDGEVDWVTLGLNLATACAGFTYLHMRWRKLENRALTPQKVQDVFE